MKTQSLVLPIEIEMLRGNLRIYGVEKASVFGSYTHGYATPESDLDQLVQLAPGRTYWDLGALQYELDRKIPGGVDIATRLNQHFEPYIRPDLVEIL